MSLLGSMETLGGPYLLLPEKHLGTWAGDRGRSFFDEEDESDYEVLCDLVATTDQPNPEDGFIALSQEFPAVELHQMDRRLFIIPCVLLENGETLADQILGGGVPVSPPRFEVFLPTEFFPLAIFDAALSGDELSSERRVILQAPCLDQLTMTGNQCKVEGLIAEYWTIG